MNFQGDELLRAWTEQNVQQAIHVHARPNCDNNVKISLTLQAKATSSTP